MVFCNSGPLVSVIIINHNYGRYLADAIESAIHQTYRPLEIIVVDDGSTDDSLDILRMYQHLIEVIAQQNSGVAAAVDTGIRNCKGDFYVLLSADDVLHPDYVMKTLAALKSNPGAAFAYTHMFLFGTVCAILKSKEYNIQTLLKGNYISGTALVRTSCYHIAGGYDSELPMYEDWDHWLNFARHGLYGVLVPEPLLYWRQHSQASRNNQPKKTAKQAVRRIREKHRDLQPWWFWLADSYERATIKMWRGISVASCNIWPKISNWCAELADKMTARRSVEITPVPRELATPRFDFLEKKCCALGS